MFKKGERVKLVDADMEDGYYGLRDGDIGTVLADLTSKDDLVFVDFDKMSRPGYCLYPKQVKKIGASELYARDILTFAEYRILHNHLADDEFSNMRMSVEYDKHTDNKLNIIAHETATNILVEEELESLLEYDLYHVLNYDEVYLPIVNKIEVAVRKRKRNLS